MSSSRILLLHLCRDLKREMESEESNLSPRKPDSVGRYFSTASAKRRKVKQEDCKFCEALIPGKDLLNHLKGKKTCMNLYMRILKVTSEKHLVIKLFSCEFCFETKQLNFKNHMSKNEDCYAKYCRKYKANDLESLFRRVQADKRAALPSRSRSVRTVESAKQKKRVEESRKNKTQAASLNDFRASTVIANYKLCVNCLSNCSEFGAKEVKEHDKEFAKHNLGEPNKQNLRRMQKFYLCNHCEDDSSEQRPLSVETSVTLSEVSDGENILFFPSNISDTLYEADDTVVETNIALMFPHKIDSVDMITDVDKVKNQSKFIRRVYETRSLKKSDITICYENELYKFKYLKESEDKFVGIIKNLEDKELSNVEKVASDFKIPGSQSWFNHQVIETRFRQEQFGHFFVNLSVEMPHASLANIATCLVQDGFVVTYEKIGSANGELVTSYYVHPDHKSDEDCSDDCKARIDLLRFLETETFDVSTLRNRHIGTYLSSVQQKVTSFVKNIIQAPSEELFAENYHILLAFDLNGQARLVGVTWPTELEKMNLDIAQNKGKLTQRAELLAFMDRNISVSSDARILRSVYNISETEAKELSALVKKHQVHMYDDSPELPSLKSFLTEVSSVSNFETSKIMLKCMIDLMKSLHHEQKMALSTYDWLDLTWEKVIGEITEDNNFLKVAFNEDEELSFETDERFSSFLAEFSSSPLTAAYHYALSCCSEGQEARIILRRVKIVECYTKPFNPLVLKAADSSTIVTVGRKVEVFGSLLSSKGQASVIGKQLEIPKLIFTHKEISLEEAFFSFDKTKKRVNSSTTVGFVNAKANRRVCFKRAGCKSDDNFKIIGSDDEFEMMSNIISRHFTRLNGCCLLLAETVVWFEYVGKEKSEKFNETYRNSMDIIPLSDEHCVNAGEDREMIPDFLLCRNGDVLKKRAKRSVLVYPEAKSKFDTMYSRLLLFFPLKREEDLFESDLRDKFSMVHHSGQGTVVDVNERNLFQLKVQPTLSVPTTQDDGEHSDHNQDDESNLSYVFGEDALDCLINALDSDDEN